MENLTINDLSVHTANKQKTLLDNIYCYVSPGEILAIVGPNGAGKSTMLHAIAGDFPEHEGKIKLADIPLETKDRAKHISILPQLSLLNFPYQVYEVVLLGRIPHSTGIESDKNITAEILDILDISDLSHRLYTELSGGEKQRVQLARALSQIWRDEDVSGAQRILLLDEPTAALDLGHQYQLMQILKNFSATGVIIVMVLHDLNLAARYADKVLALLKGKTLAFDKTNIVMTVNTIETLFATKVTITSHPDHASPIILSQL